MNDITMRAADSKSRILLTSVFGPFAQDDEYGSRKINPMELFHNQVTRVQGPFSLRMFHPSHGLIMIKENISAPCTLLDFPDLDRFIAELETHRYDIIGISSIIPNVGKVKKMCELIRERQPHAAIVVGGHVANIPDLNSRIDADHIVRGEGIRWFRKFLGEDETAPIKHPATISAFGSRILGVPLRTRPGDIAAIVIPSVGCPMGCNFCATSHLFGGKGKSINFYETGDELFSVICDIEKTLKVHSFFVMDENFLLNKKRTLRLLELMIENKKSWSFSIFSSAKVIKSYSDDQLIRLGIAWIWMGLEGKNSSYVKLDSIDTKSLVIHLQTLGIRVLGSTIIGLEDHTPENINQAIEWAVSHNTVFHQFMLYTPIPGTPLHEKHRKDGTLLSEEECPLADSHGQYRFNFRHQSITDGRETDFLLKAFQRDFETNGPSLLRLIRTMLHGWQSHKNHPDPCVRKRAAKEYHNIKTVYAAAVRAMVIWFKSDKHMRETASGLLKDLYDEFGWKTRLIAEILGPGVYQLMKREARKLAAGWTYEPATRYEKNTAAWAIEQADKDDIKNGRKTAWEVPVKELKPVLDNMDVNYSD